MYVDSTILWRYFGTDVSKQGFTKDFYMNNVIPSRGIVLPNFVVQVSLECQKIFAKKITIKDCLIIKH